MIDAELARPSAPGPGLERSLATAWERRRSGDAEGAAHFAERAIAHADALGAISAALGSGDHKALARAASALAHASADARDDTDSAPADTDAAPDQAHSASSARASDIARTATRGLTEALRERLAGAACAPARLRAIEWALDEVRASAAAAGAARGGEPR